MKGNDEDEYFQRMKLDKRKEESKFVCDMIVKLKDYTEDVEEELKMKEIILKKLKVSDERIDEITSQYLGWLE